MQTKSYPIYDNIRVLNMDGEPIFFANKKRANWYLKRGAAKVVSDNPLTIQFTFRSKGHGKRSDPFYLQEMKNLCVVCGSLEQLTQHHCVPACYRTHFPQEIKSHSSHDVLVVCSNCHHKYEHHAYEFRKELSKEFGVSMGGLYDADPDLVYAIKSAKTLLKHGDNIPEDKRNVLIDRIKKHLGKEVVEQSDLKEIIRTDKGATVVAHGKLMVDKLIDIPKFIKRWRGHFVKFAKPKYLPEHWSIDREKP